MALAGVAAPAIELRALRKHYGSRAALRGIDLAAAGPQILGVVGPDGAGKTTLLRALAGLLEVEAERSIVLGFDLREDTAPLRAKLGYVPQSFGLYRELSIRENLLVTGRLHGLPDRAIAARGEMLLGRTGLRPFIDRPAGALSGGMKQKLAIASALLAEPRLLVLDEPTAGVDIVARDEIWAILNERRAEVLIVVSTSYLNEVEMCDRLAYLEGGRVVAAGSPAELRAATPFELYRVWGAAPRAIAREARELAFVSGVAATGQYARIEVPSERSPGEAAVRAALERLPGVVLAEAAAIDIEAMMRALAATASEATPVGARA